MRMVDNKMLELFRQPGRCDLCCKRFPDGLVPHHLIRRGHGGGSRIDVAINLARLCVPCHGEIHNGDNGLETDVRYAVAYREQTTETCIRAAMDFLLSHPKHLPVTRDRCLEWGLTSPQAALACNAFTEWQRNTADLPPKKRCGLGSKRKRRTS